ncbi:MAG: Maf family protein [Acidithiobacillus sp.]
MTERALILASSSPYRQSLLQRLQIPFQTEAPQVDESPRPDETPEALVRRLAEAKAWAVAQQHPHAVVIGADQIAVCADRILGKPKSSTAAQEQLQWMQGRRIEFLNGVAVVDSSGAEAFLVPYYVWMRPLTPSEIQDYVRKDQPLDCAGSFRSEGLGISLVQRMEGDDPNALMGMPLIALSAALRHRGYPLP